MKKRMISLALALASVSNLWIAIPPNALADDIVIEDTVEAETDEAAAEIYAESDSIVSEETEDLPSEAPVSEEDVEVIAAAEEPSVNIPKITGFVPLEQTEYSVESKLPLEKLTAHLPQTIAVYLENAAEPQELAVTWQCTVDYAGTEDSSYVFVPTWDTEQYSLASALSDNVPTIAVRITLPQESAFIRTLADPAPVLTEISGTEAKVTLKWNAVSNVNEYHIYRKTNSTNWTKIGLSRSLTYTDETAQTAVSYSYAVRAITIRNGTEVRSERSIPFVRVGQPTVSSIEESSGGLRISWNAVESAEGYVVYRRTSSNADWALLGEATQATYTDDSAKNGTTYWYAVRAVCTNAGTKFYSAYSKAKSGKRTLATPKVTSIAGTKTKVTLKWRKVSEAKRYRIQRKESTESWKTLGTTTKLTYQDKTAKASKTYRYRVCAGKTDASGKMIYGMGQVPGLQRPGTTKLIGAVSEANGIRVKWNAVSGVKKYRVYRKTKAGAKWKLLDTPSESSYLDTSAAAGNTYWYTVRAVGRNPTDFYGGGSEAGIKATRTAAAPGLTKIENTTKGIGLEWNKAGNAVGYRLYRKNGGAAKWTTLKKSTKKTSYTDTTAQPGKKYTYAIRVILKNNALSDYSATRSITYLKAPSVKTARNTSTGIQVTWGTVSGASGYYLYRRANGGNWTQLQKLSGRTTKTYTDQTAENGTLYEYTVSAYYGTTASARSSTGVSGCYLKAVGLQDLIQEESRTIQLSWETNSQADGYVVSYSTSESFRSEKTVQVSGGQTKIGGLTVDEIYYFRVKAYKTINGTRYETAWSESQVAAVES